MPAPEVLSRSTTTCVGESGWTPLGFAEERFGERSFAAALGV